MATHSSILAWEISWTEESGGLQSMGSQKRHKSKTKQQQQRHYIQHSKSFPLTSGTRRGCPSLLFLFNTVQKAPARVSREEKERKGIQTRIDVIVQVLSHVRLLQPQTVACQTPLSMRFPRREYWSGLPFPSSEWVVSLKMVTS